MICKGCGTTITEQTFSIYRKLCLPCFRRLPIQRLKAFCDYAVPFLVLVLFLPVFVFSHIFRRLWRSFLPLPFMRAEILQLMTPHFGYGGAIKYADGLKRGFQDYSPQRRHYCHHIPKFRNTSASSLFFTIGRKDGAVLRRDPKQLQKILDRRCSAPYKNKPRKQRRFNRDKHLPSITLVLSKAKIRRLHPRRLSPC